jgi:hypothetical protein
MTCLQQSDELLLCGIYNAVVNRAGSPRVSVVFNINIANQIDQYCY